MSDSDMTNSCSSCGSSSSCGGSDCSTCGGCSTDANQHSTITLTMEDDTEVECAILTIFPVDAKEGTLRFFLLTKRARIMTVKFICIPSPALQRVLPCFPILKATKSTIRLLSHLTLFYRMRGKQKLPEHL